MSLRVLGLLSLLGCKWTLEGCKTAAKKPELKF